MVSPPFTSNFFTTTSGTRTHYLRSGDSSGTLVICLHGLGGSVNTFTTLAKSLSPAYDTVLVDFQGFGKTALKSTSEPLSLQKHVSDLHDLVSFLQGDGNGVAQGRKVGDPKDSNHDLLLIPTIGRPHRAFAGHYCCPALHGSTFRSRRPRSSRNWSFSIPYPSSTAANARRSCQHPEPGHRFHSQKFINRELPIA